MSTNPFFRKITEKPEVVEPGQRKPPQRALDARPDELRALQVANGSSPVARNMLAPSSWTEAIQNPLLWAELRPLLVDEE